MSSSKKKNYNEDSSDKEYVVSEFSYVFASSSNDGEATVNSSQCICFESIFIFEVSIIFPFLFFISYINFCVTVNPLTICYETCMHC